MARTWAVAAGAAVAGLAVSAGLIAAAGPWQGGQRSAERADAHHADARAGHGHRSGAKAAHRPPAVLDALPGTGSTAAAPPTAAALGKALDQLLADPALGSHPAAAVVDAATGRVLYQKNGGRGATPASTTKLLTSTAALSLLGPDHRITTTAVRGKHPGEVVLVGGGDPTLSALPAPKDGSPKDSSPKDSAAQDGAARDDQPARLTDLADRTAAALKRSGTTTVTLRYDLSAYTGPRLHPIGQNENLAGTVPLMADEGRVDPHTIENAPRVADPAADAAAKFAALLGKRGVTVDGAPAEGHAPAHAARLGAVHSRPLSELVEKMLTESDNDLAEALARQVAHATGADPSFAGAADAVRKTDAKLGIPVAGVALHDGSGLNRHNTIPPTTLARTLALDASADHPRLRPITTGLPVAALTGTLEQRYRAGGPRSAAGLVRAKTGSLTGVDTLAGLAPDASGRLLSFAFMSNGSTDAVAARAALDRLAAATVAAR